MPSTTASGAEFRGSKTPRIVAIIRRLVDPETGDHAFGEADPIFALARMHRSKANQLPKIKSIAENIAALHRIALVAGLGREEVAGPPGDRRANA
jgi:hypothetical protein